MKCPECGEIMRMSRMLGIEGEEPGSYPPSMETSMRCRRCEKYFVSLRQRDDGERVIEIFWSEAYPSALHIPTGYRDLDTARVFPRLWLSKLIGKTKVSSR